MKPVSTQAQKSALAAALAITLNASSAFAQEPRFSSFKDKLFAYAKVIEQTPDSRFRRLDYDELRDVNGRDRLPGYRAKSKYVFRVKGGHKDLALTRDGIATPYYAAGASAAKAKIIVAYIHGNGGNRKQGINIRTFGGNFGRLQNLVVRNGGRYLSPGFNDFGIGGFNQVGSLLKAQREENPNAPIILACGSQGSMLCWRLVNSPAGSKLVDGLVLLGGMPNNTYLKVKRKIPIYIAHGSKDKVFQWETLKSFRDSAQSKQPTIPVVMDLFNTGSHGTPLRMIDWRRVLSFMGQHAQVHSR